MADPLSIAAGVIGILTAAAQVSHLLINFTRNSKDAPQTAQIVLTEVNEISGTLSHLQSFLLGNETLDRSRTQLLQVDQVVTVVSGCVLTFSELEKLLDSLKTDNMGIRDCVRWARKEKLITGLVQRLQNHKASLSLVLHILNSNTLVEAKSSVDRLQELIEHCYKEMSSRVEALELQNRQHFDRFSTQTCPDTDVSSIRTVKGPNVNRSGEISRQLDSVSPSSCFTGSSVCDYVESLQKSWVYRRSNALDPSRLSIYSRDGRSMTWSTFSGISCEEISQISVIGLPIHIEEVYNPRRVSQTWTADKLVHSKPNAPVSYYKVDKNKQALLFMPSEVSLSWACNLHQYMPDRPCKVCGDQISIDGYVFEVISGGDERKEEDWRFWCHDCFRCHECNAHPNPNAKLGLLQGELPLCEICYTSCSTCGSEMVGRYIKFRLRPHVSVEEYQCEACWMTCLTCSYCEREIAGGDYARTGSETFCMDCHNTLMARRRKTEDSKPGALLTSLDLPVILT